MKGKRKTNNPKIARVNKINRLADPLWFARGVLGSKLWSAQKEILAAVRQHSRVAVKACHASGKTHAIAIAVLWWLVAYPDGIVVTTAPTWLQVEQVVWGEIRKVLQQARSCGRVRFPRPQRSELRLGPGNFAIGISTDDPSRFQGFHSRHVLIVLDEAPGVRGDIYEAIEGIRAGGDVHVLAIGNPTIASGPFYAAFTTERASWKTFTISAFDSPNLRGFSIEELRRLPAGLPPDNPIFAHQPWPDLVNRRWVYEKFWEWGEDSPTWQSRVLGNFQELESNSLIPLQYLEQAREPKRPADDENELYAGIDVADSGECETACVVVTRNGRIVKMGSWHGNARGQVIRFLYPFKDRLIRINYDKNGVGAYFANDFESFGLDDCNGVNVGAASRKPDRYRNLKAQLYWKVRQMFVRGKISGLTDEVLIAQLTSIRYEINSRGQIEIESKPERMRRGMKSPDRAEALMLACSDLTPGLITYYRELDRHGESTFTDEDDDDCLDEIVIESAGDENLTEQSDEDPPAVATQPEPITIEQERAEILTQIENFEAEIALAPGVKDDRELLRMRLRVVKYLAEKFPEECTLEELVNVFGEEELLKSVLEDLQREWRVCQVDDRMWKYKRQIKVRN